MCCLFGLIDIHNQLSGAEKHRIISILAEASEARGTDATGYACNSGGKLIIEKQPLPAHRMKFRIPRDSKIIMGHTRMTTKGDAQQNRNNHPFFGKAAGMPFALAHNGVLSNDTLLKTKFKLPESSIETDSYTAVQLIQHKNALDLDTVKFMAEQVKGTFNFTILDRDDRLYIIRGNNPLCLYYFKKMGLYLYASTRPILEAALDGIGYGNLSHEEVRIQEGQILMIEDNGKRTWARFTPPVSFSSYYMYDFRDPYKAEPTGYRKFMMEFGESLGIPKQELDWMHQMGYATYDIEEAIFNSNYRSTCLMESGYYDDMEDDLYEFNHDCFRNYAWL